MNPDINPKETIAAFQRYFRSNDGSEIESLSLDELRSADEHLGERDTEAGYRIALRNRIADLERAEQRGHESNIRASNLIARILIGLFIGLLVAGLVARLIT